MRDVDLPVLLREQVVVTDLAVGDSRHGLVSGKERFREQDVLPFLGEDTDGHLEGSGRSVGHDDVSGSDPPVAVRSLVKVVGDCEPRVGVTDRFWVAERATALERLLDGGDRFGRGRHVAKD